MKDEMTEPELHKNMFLMFLILTGVSVITFIGNVIFVADNPPTPPSLAQAKSIRKDISSTGNKQTLKETFKKYKQNIVILGKQWTFWIVWITNASTIPLLRNFTTLLSSALHDDFRHGNGKMHINMVTGNALSIAWIVYTIFSFITGPCISRFRKYKEVVLISVGITFICNMFALFGLAYRKETLVLASVIILSASVGVANIAIFETLAEVTYPVPMMFASAALLYGHGTMRFLYPIVSRILLDFVSSWASMLLPVMLTFVSTVLLFFLEKNYKRTEANKSRFETELIAKK